MGILERYILKEFLKILGLTLGILLVISLTIQFFEKIQGYAEYDPSFRSVLMLLLIRLPKTIFEMLPIALLLSSILTVGTFSRTHELTAMQIGGIRITRAFAPLLGAGLLISLLLLVANLSLIPSANRQASLWKQTAIEKKSQQGYFKRESVWMPLSHRRFLNIQLIEPTYESMSGISLYRLSPNFRLEETLEAEKMLYRGGQWHLQDGIQRTFLPDLTLRIQPFDKLPLSLNLLPEDFQRIRPRENQLTYAQLSRYRDRLSSEGLNARQYEVEMAVRTALPFTGLVMVLLGVSYGIRRRVHGGISRSIGICLIIVLAYKFVHDFSLVLGGGDTIPPWLGAWMAHGIFFGIGGIMFLRIRE